MRVVDLIRKKRDGEALNPSEIRFLVHGATTGEIPTYQLSAWLMAVLFRGMSSNEIDILTQAMTDSGSRLDLSTITAPRVDKHSTGGVGDKTSPVLAPLAAACGVVVPMMSGRGLGHTGGTLDKLESIPGFQTDLAPEEALRILDTVGCCLFGQTEMLAPADRVLYALRDVTATVESIPLIAASIMSKKLAVDLDGLVLDVTVGLGAFMKNVSEARELADRLVAIGEAAGVRMRAVLTTMDAPRGRAVGNALEIAECIATLRGEGPKDLEVVSIELAARMVEVAGLEPSLEASRGRVRAALKGGDGLEKLREIVEAQGGDPRIIDNPRRLPTAPSVEPVTATRSGYLTAVDAELIGRATKVLGAGRDQLGQMIDHAVGAVMNVALGESVRAGDPVVDLHHRDARGLDEARQLISRAVRIDDVPPATATLILDTVA
jgi:pyrimidine-nucleoside phosphorylase